MRKIARNPKHVICINVTMKNLHTHIIVVEKRICERHLEHDHEQKFPDHITTFHHISTRYDNPLHSSSP